MLNIFVIFTGNIAITMPILNVCHNGTINKIWHDIMAFDIKRLYNREFFLNLMKGVLANTCGSRILLPDSET
jgi:hypothetical protein